MKKVRLFFFDGLTYLLAQFARLLTSLLLKTCRIKYEGDIRPFFDLRVRPLLVAFWHEDLFPMTHLLIGLNSVNKYAAAISNSRDAEVLAKMINFYRNSRCIRVHHNSKHRALAKMVAALKGGEIVAITPDGPKGPACQAKLGISFAGYMTKGFVSPVTWKASAHWRLSTWDKLKIPKPFSTITVVFGDVLPALEFSKDDYHLAIEKGLNKLKEFETQVST